MHDYSVTTPTRFEKVTRFLGLFLIAPLLGLATIPVAVHISRKADFGLVVHRLDISSTQLGGPADQAGLIPGDHILAVDGKAVGDMAHYYAAMAENYDLTPKIFTVARGSLTLTRQITPRPVLQKSLIRDYGFWVTGLAFLLMGWWVFSRREDLVARNFFALCTMFAFLLLEIPDLPWVPYMQLKEILRAFAQLMLPAYFLRFFLQFPTPRPHAGGKAHRWRKLLWPGWLLFLGFTLGDWIWPGHSMNSLVPKLEILALVYSLGFFLAGLLVFAKNIRRRDRPIQRTKMQVILVGLLVGLLPFLAAMIIGNLHPQTSMPQWQYLGFSLLLVPLSFSLAIMRYGALDKSFVLRMSLIYGVLTLTVLAAYFLIVVLLGQILARLFGISTYPVLLLVVAASSLTILPLRRLIQSWIDHHFYPARQANRKALNQLAQELTGLIEVQDVISSLLGGLKNLFQPTDLTLFLTPHSDSTHFQASTLAGQESSWPEAGLAHQSSLAILLNRLRRPVFAEELEDLLFTGETDSDSLTLLTRLKVNLLIPLVSGNRLLGFIALGPKSSGALYSQEDLSNLNNLAVQAGSLLESRLLYRESLRTKKLETELELARQIQRSLLPDQPLQDKGFAIAGRNESCRRVGGDYFDYFLRSDGCLCFALADVSGKGIPASLHMTSLRVAFRQEAEAEDLAHLVIKRLNGTFCRLSTPGNFICFFYGIWNPATGLLQYCNAGCEPPILLRPSLPYHQYLRKGGPVLGVAEDFPYRQGSLSLEPQDRLFLYTDGLTDQQSPQDEFFDLPRLLSLLENNVAESPPALLEKIFNTINLFGGPDRTDDKTAICLEINKLAI